MFNVCRRGRILAYAKTLNVKSASVRESQGVPGTISFRSIVLGLLANQSNIGVFRRIFEHEKWPFDGMQEYHAGQHVQARFSGNYGGQAYKRWTLSSVKDSKNKK